MKLIEKIKGVVRFFLYDGKEVSVYKDKIKIGDEILSSKEDDDYYCVNDVLYKAVFDEETITASYFRYDGISFTESAFRYDLKKYLDPQRSCSLKNSKGLVKVSFNNNGDEFCFEFATDSKYYILNYDSKNEVVILISKRKGLLFYTKTGERLWEYQVEEGLEINENGVTVVDDIVVIPSSKNSHPELVEGYNLLTGEKLWEVDDKDCCDYCYSLGPNNMLYSLASYHCYDHTTELRFKQINPSTGESEMSVLKEGDYWKAVYSGHVAIHGNKLFYVNLNKSEGCSLGVIDLETKELIEDMPLKSEGFHIDKPVVTDEKIYVFIHYDDDSLNELRIYENEYK